MKSEIRHCFFNIIKKIFFILFGLRWAVVKVCATQWIDCFFRDKIVPPENLKYKKWSSAPLEIKSNFKYLYL